MKNLSFNFLFYIFLFLAIFASCDRNHDVVVQGMAGVYVSENDFSKIKRSDPIPIGELGGIVNVGDYLFINEQLKGIHVIDNSDPSFPEFIHFWHIPGNTQFTIQDDVLYADNTIHIIVIDISDYSNINYIDHIENVYLEDDLSEETFYPPDYSGPFECYKKDNGILTGWESRELLNPACRAY